MIKIALIGSKGSWGRTLLELSKNIENIQVTELIDHISYNNAINFTKQIKNVDAAIIASSTITRNNVIEDILEIKSIPLYIEKPIATNYKTLDKLTKYAINNIVYTGHQDLIRQSISQFKLMYNPKANLKISMGNFKTHTTKELLWGWGPHALGLAYYLTDSTNDSITIIFDTSNILHLGHGNIDITLLKNVSVRKMKSNNLFWENNSPFYSVINDVIIKENAVLDNLKNFTYAIKHEILDHKNNFEIARKTTDRIIELDTLIK